MGWALTNWTYLEGRAIKDGLLRQGSLLSYEPTIFLSYVESIVREFGADELDKLYTPETRESRNAELMAAMEAFAW